ncbi:hypothetical protein BV898_17201 [Hypsibius exemplaris]|uniref:Uncharacterized protein n=1 Tax=Hypsibius exemplaris TaxID=2072580 RepID=A0A9X6RLT4_HYPEX|nr:hypothetical protein BV898_17201 [Hypsibius exemplaris]
MACLNNTTKETNVANASALDYTDELNLVVLGHEKPIRSDSVYLMTISLADIVVLWDNIPPYITLINPNIMRCNPDFLKGYNEHHGMGEWGFRMFVNLSDWTLIVFSVVRLMAVLQPFRFGWVQSLMTP